MVFRSTRNFKIRCVINHRFLEINSRLRTCIIFNGKDRLVVNCFTKARKIELMPKITFGFTIASDRLILNLVYFHWFRKILSNVLNDFLCRKENSVRDALANLAQRLYLPATISDSNVSDAFNFGLKTVLNKTIIPYL